jgi:isoquinoline 1-oxidoreductase alpha subunit
MLPMKLTVNGKTSTVDVDDDTPLLWILRDQLALTGTKYGCGIGVCGACTILEGSAAVRACQITAAAADGKSYTTIEGLKNDRCQRAWLEEDVAQCGYCQPGMLMEACALLTAHSSPSDAQIDDAIGSHICRCGTYPRIRKAIHLASTLRKR